MRTVNCIYISVQTDRNIHIHLKYPPSATVGMGLAGTRPRNPIKACILDNTTKLVHLHTSTQITALIGSTPFFLAKIVQKYVKLIYSNANLFWIFFFQSELPNELWYGKEDSNVAWFVELNYPKTLTMFVVSYDVAM